MRKLHISVFAAALLAAAVCSAAQEEETEAKTEAKPDCDARMAWFRDAKFGMFVHWGIYSVPAGEWKGKTSYAEWFQLQTKMPCEQYDKFAAEFNPVKFDARQWAKTAKDAGMKYLVITSKHHDGFSMFDTKFSDFNIVRSTPYRRDPMKELAAACRDSGIKFCFYYSIADWHNPDSPAVHSQRGFHGNPKDDADLAKYADYMRNQVHELLTGYGPVSIIWFDGGGAFKTPDRAKLLKADEMVKMIHAAQPDCLINNRLGAGSDYGTPEQYIPAGGAKEPFEVCMTLNGHWGYNKADHNWKSTSSLVRNLIDIVSKGGNYLLNVGPTSEGLIPSASIERLKEIGVWLKANGESIYGAGPTAFGYELGTPGKPDSRGRAKNEGALGWRCTTKPGKFYIHIFDWPEGKFELKEVKPKVTKAYLLADRDKPLTVTQEADRATVQLPPHMPDAIATVLCLEHE
jgi:alpha-L-fucosidase